MTAEMGRERGMEEWGGERREREGLRGREMKGMLEQSGAPAKPEHS